MKITKFLLFGFFSIILSASTFAANIIQITADERGIPFFLDDAGHVWAFKDPVLPRGMQKLVKISGLEKIKQIAPYIALDNQGRVFIWSLDLNELDTVEGELWHTGYTTPTLVKELHGITQVANANYHFYALKDNREILMWEIKRGGQYNYATLGTGPIKSLYTGRQIRKIAVAPDLDNRENYLTLPYGVIALFEDGTVMGWGVTQTGQLSMEKSTDVVLTQSAEAIDVAMNAYHTTILTRKGEVKFWGGCDLFGRGGYIVRDWNPGHISGIASTVKDVKSFTLAKAPIFIWGDQGDDNMFYNVFLKQDGTVWLSVAPIPDNPEATKNCRGRDYPDIDFKNPRNIKIGSSPAIQASTGGDYLYILDSAHRVWATHSKNSVYKLNQLKELNRIQLDYNSIYIPLNH